MVLSCLESVVRVLSRWWSRLGRVEMKPACPFVGIKKRRSSKELEKGVQVKLLKAFLLSEKKDTDERLPLCRRSECRRRKGSTSFPDIVLL